MITEVIIWQLNQFKLSTMDIDFEVGSKHVGQSFLTILGEYEYEKEGYDLGDGIYYLPDFYFPKIDIWAEVKPTGFNNSNEINKIEKFVAGIACKNDYTYNEDILHLLGGAHLQRTYFEAIILLDGYPENKIYQVYECDESDGSFGV